MFTGSLLLLGCFAGVVVLLSSVVAAPGDALYLPLKLTQEIGQMLALELACIIVAVPAIHGERLWRRGPERGADACEWRAPRERPRRSSPVR